MKFPSLKIENFLAITEAEISLADRGLVLIVGKNSMDTSAVSNGAGKSSIADALCWAWYGVTARGESGDDIVNVTAGKGCRVTSTLQDGGLLYTATRHRKHKTGKNTLTLTMHDGIKETILTKGTDKLTQEVANQVIGASLDVFVGSIYAGQERMPDLPAMTDKQLKILIEEASGVLVLEEAYRSAMEIAKTAEQSYNAAGVAEDGHQATINWTDGEIKASTDRINEWSVNRGARVQVLKDQVATTVLPELRQVMEDVKKIIPGEAGDQIALCDVKITAVKGEQEERVRLDGQVALLSGQVRSAETVMENAGVALERHEKAHVHVGDKIGEPCTECGRPLTAAELGDATKTAKERADLAASAYRDAEAALTSFETAYKKAGGERDAFLLTLTDVSAVSAQRASWEAVRASQNALISRRDVLTKEAKDFKVRIEGVIAEVNPHEAHIAALEAKRVVNVKDLEDAISLRKKLEESALIDRDVAKVFGPAGVRARILDEVTPFLNAQTSKYLDVLSDGNLTAMWSTLTPGAKKGTFKEKFSIEVANETGGKTFKSISGGEKRKVRIATALALQDLVATRASKPIDLFIGDEIDDALDVAGIERLTMVLEEKANERGSVFIISHNEIRDMVKNVIEIEKTAAGTVVREVSA